MMCTQEQEKMKISKFINRLTIAAFATIVSLGQAFSQDGGEVVDKIVAKVDDHIILKSEVESTYISFISGPQGQEYVGDARCLILKNFIENKVLLAMSEIDSVLVDPARVEYELDGRMQQIIQRAGSAQAIEDAYGKTIEQLMNELRPGVREQLQIQEQEQSIVSDVSVTPAEIRRFFNQIPKDSLPLYSTEYEVGMIVKIPEPSSAEKQKVRDQLIKIRERALNGESFEILALEYSEGPSRTRGGNLGFASRNTMDPAYEAGALALKPGEISMPIESSFGIHLIQLIEKRGNEYNSRHILIKPKASEADFERASASLDSLRTLISADSITFEEAAKQFSDDQGTKVNGDSSAALMGRIAYRPRTWILPFTLPWMQ